MSCLGWNSLRFWLESQFFDNYISFMFQNWQWGEKKRLKTVTWINLLEVFMGSLLVSIHIHLENLAYKDNKGLLYWRNVATEEYQTMNLKNKNKNNTINKSSGWMSLTFTLDPHFLLTLAWVLTYLPLQHFFHAFLVFSCLPLLMFTTS